jgi:hypothetical protein
MKFESRSCEWCNQLVQLDPARIVSERMGFVVLRGKDGKMHSFGRTKKEMENNEPTIESSATQERTDGREGAEANREEEQAFIRFSESVFGE